MAGEEAKLPEALPEQVRVRNTFIDTNDPKADMPPLPGQLQRSSTAPPNYPVSVTRLFGDDPEPPDRSDDQLGEGDEENDEAPEGDESPGDEGPPQPGELQRLKTHNIFDYEPQPYWDAWRLSGMEPEMPPAPVQPPQWNEVPVPMPYMPVAVHPVQVFPIQPFVPDGPQTVPSAPQTLERTFSRKSGQLRRIEWTVDSRKLRGNDKQAVSPSFDVVCGGKEQPFKLMIYPKQITDQKGGASFKKSKGRGTVTVKCEADPDPHQGSSKLAFRIFIGSETTGNKQEPRGPKTHDFATSAVGALPKDLDEWDFSSVVDTGSSTFLVCLEIQSCELAWHSAAHTVHL